MIKPLQSENGILLLVAGLKGAIGSTLAVAAQALKQDPDAILPYLMTAQKLPFLGNPNQFHIAGWDTSSLSMEETLAHHKVLNQDRWAPYAERLNAITIKEAPDSTTALRGQTQLLIDHIQEFKAAFPGARPVFINLLPAGRCHDLESFANLDELYAYAETIDMPDLAYVLAAIEAGVPVVNFSPNEVEIPAVVYASHKQGVPIAGRDGKTGQTYLKVVLASALRARKLLVNGWYSLNILGNADGENLMAPENAAAKLANKTDVLENALGYQPGQKRYAVPSHSVRIDYYAPRGDAKEAWDVIDFEGVFGLNMSLRLNLQGRDSILAAPLVLDLARWVAAMQIMGRSGPISELAFYFKSGVEITAPNTFEAQLACLAALEESCNDLIAT
jgi:myo-inositol-1-phosphate synthase